MTQGETYGDALAMAEDAIPLWIAHLLKDGQPVPEDSTIAEPIRTRDYFLSSHAEEELVEDEFDRTDMGHASLAGFVAKRLTQDPRGTR